MTEQEHVVVIEEVTETVPRFARIKNVLAKVNTTHIAVAATAVGVMVGMAIVSRIDVSVERREEEPTVIDVEPEPEI